MFLDNLFINILNMSITASYVIIIVMAVRFLIRKFPKKYSYYLWGLVGLRLIFPFSVSSVFSLFNLNMFTDIHNVSGKTEYIPLDIGYADTPSIDVGIDSINDTVNNLLPPAEVYNSVNPMQILIFFASIIWITGIALIFGYELFLFFKTRKLVKKAVLLKENIYECDNIPTPFVTGFIISKIYIPFRLKECELSYILCHEKYHIKRHDNIIKAISSLLLIIYWFNPLVWIAYFYMNRDMEMSCDEKVISEMGDGIIKDYGNTLLSFALNRRHIPLGPLYFGEPPVKKRIKNILNFKKPKTWISFFGIFIIIILSAVCLTDGNKSAGEPNPAEKTENDNNLKNPLQADLNANFIIAGMDQTSYMADSIIVVNINDYNELNIISIPRDTYITLTEKQKQLIKETGTDAPDSIKICQTSAYGGNKYGMEILKEQAGQILGINIDYFIKINLDGFRHIIDSIGGIYFDVPELGMMYSDPIQDLHIDIKGGYQLLDGTSAEGLLRFRQGYERGDLQRIDVLRKFAETFLYQVIDKNDLSSIAASCIKYAETDFPVLSIPDYTEHLKIIKNFNGETIPGSYHMIDNMVYYIYDASETKKLSAKYFTEISE